MRCEPTFDDSDFGEANADDMAPRGTSGRFGSVVLVARLATAAAAIAGLTLFARDRVAPADVRHVWREPPHAPSTHLAAPASLAGPLLALEGADSTSKPEQPRWNASTGLREDGLSQGGFDAIEAPFLRLTLTEMGQTHEPAVSLFVTLARRAAEMQGLSVTRTGLRGAIETKFGRFETVEATLSGKGARLCTGFAGIDTRAMRIDGWLCGILGQAPEPRSVICTIDALKLAIAATPTIEIAFGQAELRRIGGCTTADGATSAIGSDATGSIAGRKTTTGDRNRRRARKNEAELRRNVEAGL